MRLSRVLVAFSIAVFACTLPSHAVAPKVKWAAYRSNTLSVQVTVPQAWVVVKSDKALGFHTPGPVEKRAAVGVMKSQSGMTVDQAADQQIHDAGNPSEWTKSPARVANLPAIKIVGTDPKSPGMKFVQYYVETDKGPYLIRCIAPEATWPLYSPLFSEILNRIKFLP